MLASFCTFLRALAHANRRPLVIGHRGYLALTADERRVMALIAAAQSGNLVLFDAHLSWLARSEARDALRIGAAALAKALNTHDLRLQVP